MTFATCLCFWNNTPFFFEVLPDNDDIACCSPPPSTFHLCPDGEFRWEQNSHNRRQKSVITTPKTPSFITFQSLHPGIAERSPTSNSMNFFRNLSTVIQIHVQFFLLPTNVYISSIFVIFEGSCEVKGGEFSPISRIQRKIVVQDFFKKRAIPRMDMPSKHSSIALFYKAFRAFLW